MADLLAARRANPYRVRAYRRAADSLLSLESDLGALAEKNQLEDIPNIGRDLADKIREFLITGTIRSYEELRAPLPAEVAEWVSLPGLSDALVSYLYMRLGIRTLEDLETLVKSHLLRTLPGFTGTEEELLSAIRQRQETAAATTRAEAP
jgi:DNA polymerase (family 10)